MKGLRNAFIPIAVYTVMGLELSKRCSLLFKPFRCAARCFSRGCLSPKRAFLGGVRYLWTGLLWGTWPRVGSPLHRTQPCQAARPARQAPNLHPHRRDLAVGFRVLLWGAFAKCTLTFCLLPPPTSEVSGSRLVRFVPVSSSHPGETSLEAQSPSSGEPGEGSWENYRKIK